MDVEEAGAAAQPDNSETEKASLRAHFRALRKAMRPAERAALSEAACAHLSSADVWKKAQSVALYMAARGEADCLPLLKQALAEGKKVLLPLCLDPERDNRMSLVPCANLESLRVGAFGILEPPAPQGSRQSFGQPDLLLAPGLAFDRQGFRLGQGGGFYDRLLSESALDATLCIGFAYSFQIVEQAPRAPWDRPTHALCTDKGLFWVDQTAPLTGLKPGTENIKDGM
ncbi:MAG: 5-formyltetrahydrofolate cyclo-ligase [Desulfovibrio sp.]|jgi:5-formyltetrahydrofolate cyclo-ligase|nr:5-formyltetrahydrofolate cyclo-ligase [Desulfovibrio sp.]